MSVQTCRIEYSDFFTRNLIAGTRCKLSSVSRSLIPVSSFSRVSQITRFQMDCRSARYIGQHPQNEILLIALFFRFPNKPVRCAVVTTSSMRLYDVSTLSPGSSYTHAVHTDDEQRYKTTDTDQSWDSCHHALRFRNIPRLHDFVFSIVLRATTTKTTTILVLIITKTRMWANAQRDGRPAENMWRALLNAAKFG